LNSMRPVKKMEFRSRMWLRDVVHVDAIDLSPRGPAGYAKIDIWGANRLLNFLMLQTV
jgi:hypothetical protein